MKYLLFISVLIGVSVVCAADRPKIGLALSGGGARGMAHVGVLKVLEREGVRVDYIAGTSMGSIIGGLYASGMTPENIEQHLQDMDWDAVFKDREERVDRSFRRKQDDNLFLAQGKVGVKDGSLRISTALIQGQKFDLILNRLTRHVAGINDFDDLPIPFRAVATDLTSGEEVVLGKGNLALAMRASMSVPAAFAGVEIDGRLLVDGGMANNLPISVVRDMGADLVIAVDISSPLSEKEELKSALKVLEQLTGFLTRRNTEQQIASLTSSDLLLVPKLKEISSASFEKVDAAILSGVVSAQAAQPRLSQLSASYSGEIKRPAHEMVPEILGKITFVTDSDISQSALRRQFRIREGDMLDLDRIEAGIARIYGMGIFESVRYELTEQDSERGIIVRAVEKSWGTDFLQVGAEASSRGSDSFFNFALAYTRQPLNALNGEWRTQVQLGSEPGIATEIYQPLAIDGGYFFHGALAYETSLIRIFDGSHAVAEYEARRALLDLGGGVNLGNWAELKLGYRGYQGTFELETGVGFLPESDFTGGELYGRFTLDELDSLHFPREGGLFRAEAIFSDQALGADVDFEQLSMLGVGTFSVGEDTLILSAEVGATRLDSAPVQNQFRLGGFLRLSGLEQYQLIGQHMALVEAIYMRRLHRSSVIPVYAGLSLEAGNTWSESNEVSLNNILVAGSLFLGVDTPIGPLYLGYGHAETGQDSVYLFLGQAWSR